VISNWIVKGKALWLVDPFSENFQVGHNPVDGGTLQAPPALPQVDLFQ